MTADDEAPDSREPLPLPAVAGASAQHAAELAEPEPAQTGTAAYEQPAIVSAELEAPDEAGAPDGPAGQPATPDALDDGAPADEPTTIVAAAPAVLEDEYLDDESTTILVADPGRDEDEATTIVAASEPAAPTENGQPPDAARAAAPAAVQAQDTPAWHDYAAEEPTTIAAPLSDPEPGDATEIMLATPQDDASLPAEGPERAWFDGRLQDFTTALKQDEAGRPRPPQERQMLAASARDMIARVAMHRARLVEGGTAEGWAADTVLQPDQLLANTYIVRSLIARGGIGEIYRTRHRDLKTEHAIKILLPRYALDPTLLTLMLDEARLLQCVRHEAVVGCQDLLRDADGRPMLVMDYLRGRTLSSRLREGRLPTSDLIVLAHRLADGLAAIHDAGIVHQDISPDNVILTEDSCAAATIIDFGLARSLGSVRDTHQNLDFAGKFSWSSPEQLSGRATAVDTRSDLYSLGLMLAAAARGYRLDMGTDLESARAARTSVPSLAGIEQPVAGLLEVLLAPSPSARLASAREVHALLTPAPVGFLDKLKRFFRG